MDNAGEEKKNAMDQQLPQQPPQFQHLPTDVQRHILRLAIDPALRNTPFSTSHLTYALVCRQWKSMVYSLISSVDIFSLLHEMESNTAGQKPYMEKRFDQVVCFVRKNKESIRSLAIDCDARGGELFNKAVEHWREFLNPKALDKILGATPQLETLQIKLRKRCGRTQALVPSIKCLSSLKRVALCKSARRAFRGPPTE